MLKIVFLPKATLRKMFKLTIIKSPEFKYLFCLKKNYHCPLIQLNNNTSITQSLIHTHWGQQYNHRKKMNVKGAQSCLTLCDCIVHGILQARTLEWQPFPSPEDLPNPGMWEPRFPTLRADFYQLSHKGSPIIPESYPKSWSVCSNKLKQKKKMDPN